MFHKISKESMYSANNGWLESRFHFSFAEYRNLDNINFGVLRVLNDDIIHPNSGFDMHPHHDMEIISYIVDGEISHKDSMGNQRYIKRGEVQYMSAGTGVMHSEYNHHETKDLRLLQIWIIPPRKGLQPIYGEELYKPNERINKLLNIVSSQNGSAKVKIHQDINIYVSEMESEKDLNYGIAKDRQVYFVQIEGSSFINDTELNASDAMKIVDERNINIKAKEHSHFLFIDMKSTH